MQLTAATIAMLVLPSVVITATVHFKLPPGAKTVFFKIPVVVSATVINWVVVHAILSGGGVIAPFALLAGDLILVPALLGVKALHERKQRRNPKYAQASEVKWIKLPHVTPARTSTGQTAPLNLAPAA